MLGFTIDCAYCTPARTIFRSVMPEVGDELAWRRMWKSTTSAGHGGSPLWTVECPECGGRFQIVDDGIPAGSGGLVKGGNVTQPKINSLNVITGPRTGGNALCVSGDALEHGSIVVRFDGKPAPTVDQRTATTARVVVPVGVYRLNVAENLHTLSLTITSGSLALDEAVVTAGGSNGVIRQITGSTYMVVFQILVETPSAMAGTTLLGGVGGGTAIINTAELAAFGDGECVFGLTSGASGSARGGSLLIVDAPTNSFAPNELVKGSISGAMVKLGGSPANSGLVDVSVENEHGRRLVGGSLEGAYTYA